jgi:hypothetical protein
MKSRRAGATVAAVAVVLVSVLAVPTVSAGAQQPPSPPPEPELPVIPPTVCLDHEPETAADHNAFFDWRTLAVTDIQPAPDPGVAPFYGCSLVDDGTYTYLFSNNLVYGTNTATRLARVPSGRLGGAAYEYWTGSGWSTSRSDAAPVHDAGGYSYALQVSLVAGQVGGQPEHVRRRPHRRATRRRTGRHDVEQQQLRHRRGGCRPVAVPPDVR